MPDARAFALEKKFLETGTCACGRHLSEHAETFEEMKGPGIDCKLTRDEVPKWNLVDRSRLGVGA